MTKIGVVVDDYIIVLKDKHYLGHYYDLFGGGQIAEFSRESLDTVVDLSNHELSRGREYDAEWQDFSKASPQFWEMLWDAATTGDPEREKKQQWFIGQFSSMLNSYEQQFPEHSTAVRVARKFVEALDEATT